jgi:hypothetical protein
VPFSVTVSCEEVEKVATTEAALSSVSVQGPVPVQAPDHPENVSPVPGVAVSVTTVPPLKVAVHVDPQLMPAGLLVTVPVPDPCLVTTSCTVAGLKAAVTETPAFITTLQEPVPVHAPDHPAKMLPASGAAVSVTAVPELNPAAQVDPQLMPDGELVTVPVPPPVFVTVS